MVIGLRPCSNERELTWRYPVVVAVFMVVGEREEEERRRREGWRGKPRGEAGT